MKQDSHGSRQKSAVRGPRVKLHRLRRSLRDCVQNNYGRKQA